MTFLPHATDHGAGSNGTRGRGRGRPQDRNGHEGHPGTADSPEAHPRGRGAGAGRPVDSRARQEARHAQLPYSVTIGKTVVTVKIGDITTEQVDAAMSMVGQDMELKKSAVGNAFLQKCRPLDTALISQGHAKAAKGPHQLITTAVPRGSNLHMLYIFHAVLSKTDDRKEVTKIVKRLVRVCLDKTAKKGLKSVALPPLGVGKRFGYGRYTTASATVSAIQEFLHDKPDSLKNITIVVYEDFALAYKFTSAMQQTLASDKTEEEDSTKPSFKEIALNKLKQGVGKIAALMHFRKQRSLSPEIERGRFQAILCTTKSTDWKTVKDMLLKELQKTFLHSETIEEKDCVQTLKKSLKDIVSSAREMNVAITNSRSGLKVTGHKERVAQIVSTIRKEMFLGLDQRQKADQSAREQLGLPTGTDRLPSYWTVVQQDPRVTYREAVQSWKGRGIRLNKVTKEEVAAVEKLVAKTWDRGNVGKGADAKGLTHSNTKVVGVKRLENPELWKEYSHRRDKLIDDLVHHHKGSGPARTTPVDELPAPSKNPVQTTRHIGKRDLLARDIFPVEINEHYLFHGTKQETMSKIFSQGLDFRLTSNGMLGKGVYFAECPTKSDQYADDRKQRAAPGQTLTMLLVRVLLGHPYQHTNSKSPTQFKRPPCMTCKDEFCRCQGTKHSSRFFNSVIDDCRLFREFVVYGEHLCYPEYVITYLRE